MVTRTDCFYYEEIFSDESTPHDTIHGRPTCNNPKGIMVDGECTEDRKKICFKQK